MFGLKESLNRALISIVYWCNCNLPTSITPLPPPPLPQHGARLQALWIVTGLLEGARQIMMEFYKLVQKTLTVFLQSYLWAGHVYVYSIYFNLLL